jgi:uncharacterized protein DUF2505
VQYETVYAAGVEDVWATLTDRAFLEEYAREIGATSWDIGVTRHLDETQTRLRLTVPTGGIPAVFRRMVPSVLDIVEARTWSGPAGSEHLGRVAVDAAAGKRDAKVRGSLTLAQLESGTRFAMSGDIDVNVPFAKGLATSLLEQLLTRVLDDQSAVMKRWIAEGKTAGSGRPGE